MHISWLDVAATEEVAASEDAMLDFCFPPLRQNANEHSRFRLSPCSVSDSFVRKFLEVSRSDWWPQVPILLRTKWLRMSMKVDKI